jgi:hypothetical protein
MSDTATPEAEQVEQAEAAAPPKPSDVAKPEPEKPELSAEQLQAELAKVRKEAAGYRTKLREAEPLVKAAQEAEEANKTEIQRAIERAEAAEKTAAERELALYRRDLADEHGIPANKTHLLGSGSREEMEAIAAEIGPLFASAAKTPPPPSDRPVEGLRPGATPEPPKPADDSYPAEWAPPQVRDKVRSQYGQ